MTQNLITSAFELVRDVGHGVLLLDTFHRLATREVRPPPHLRGPSLALRSSMSFPSCSVADFSSAPPFCFRDIHSSEECGHCVWLSGEMKGTHLHGACHLVP